MAYKNILVNTEHQNHISDEKDCRISKTEEIEWTPFSKNRSPHTPTYQLNFWKLWISYFYSKIWGKLKKTDFFIFCKIVLFITSWMKCRLRFHKEFTECLLKLFWVRFPALPAEFRQFPKASSLSEQLPM